MIITYLFSLNINLKVMIVEQFSDNEMESAGRKGCFREMFPADVRLGLAVRRRIQTGRNNWRNETRWAEEYTVIRRDRCKNVQHTDCYILSLVQHTLECFKNIDTNNQYRIAQVICTR